MFTANIINNGNDQIVILPDEYHFSESEVLIIKIGDIVMMYPKNIYSNSFELAINFFSDDFMNERDSGFSSKREEL